MNSIASRIEDDETQPKMREFILYFLRLGTFGFGGSIANHMQRDLVKERKWVSRPDYMEGLAFSQLSPGPLAAQLAMYLGWIRAGTLGATLTGAAFVLVFLNGHGDRRAVRALWAAGLDSRRILRSGSGGDRDHRSQHV